MGNAEFINRVIRCINRLFHQTIYLLGSGIEKCYIQLIGVRAGKHIVFRGWTSFFRASNSEILLGDNVSFNSSSYSNRIGLNHQCIITTMAPDAKITIGDRTGMSSTTITSWKQITIGRDVRIGANCVIMDGDFHLDDPRTPSPSPIVIKDNVWLGANVTVMKGVEIGENTIIGMNSVVTKNIPANCVAAGIPCKVIK